LIKAAGMIAAVLVVLSSSGAAEAASLRITDSLDREVLLELPVRRVVALNSDSLEILRVLDAEDLVVGVFSEIVRDRRFWGQLAERKGVGSWRDPDIEAIASLQPDLVLAYARNPGASLEARLKAFGIQVLRLDFYKIENLEREVRVLGDLLDKSGKAEAFCAWHHRCLELIRERTAAAVVRPDVYVESYSSFHAAGPGSGGNQMCLLAGGRNVAEAFEISYPRVTPEWVLAQDVDIIVKAASGSYGGEATSQSLNRIRDEIRGRPGWSRIPAVRDGAVYVMESSVWTGPRAVIGIAYMARWFHPGLFPDLDPEAMHREYLETFQGVEYGGTFVAAGDPR